MLFTLLVSCLAAIVCASPSQPLGESKLLLAMRSTSDLQQNNPALALQCFQYYSEIFDQLLQQYEREFEACQNASQHQIAGLDETFKPVLSSLSSSAGSACQLIDNCNNQVDTSTALACYSDVGASDAKTMYNISSTASQYYGQLQQLIQMVQFTEEQCLNTGKRNYEISTEEEYSNLQICLAGNNTTITTTTATTSENTRADTSSSEPVRKTTTSVPLSSSSAPGETSSVPVETTPVPVTRTSTSVKTTSAPVTTTSVPVTRTTTSIKTTSVPVPVTTTPVPVETTADPITSTPVPIPITTTPVPVTRTTHRVRTTRVPVTRSSRPARTTSVPIMTTSAFETHKPTISAPSGKQPNLSSELKKLLHSLLY